jgi:hypothetical protein
MSMPGLSAESSLYRSSRRYRQSHDASIGRTAPMAVVYQIRFRPGPGSALRGDFGGGPIDFEPVEPPVPFASITVECANGKNYDVSTGSKKGTCEVRRRGSKVEYGICQDEDGNSALASCGIGCQVASGAGSCKLAPGR